MKGDKIKKFIIDNTDEYDVDCTCSDCEKASNILSELNQLLEKVYELESTILAQQAELKNEGDLILIHLERINDLSRKNEQLKEDALLGKAIRYLVKDGHPDVFYDLQFNDDVEGTVKWYKQQLEKEEPNEKTL